MEWENVPFLQETQVMLLPVRAMNALRSYSIEWKPGDTTKMCILTNIWSGGRDWIKALRFNFQVTPEYSVETRLHHKENCNKINI